MDDRATVWVAEPLPSCLKLAGDPIPNRPRNRTKCFSTNVLVGHITRILVGAQQLDFFASCFKPLSPAAGQRVERGNELLSLLDKNGHSWINSIRLSPCDLSLARQALPFGIVHAKRRVEQCGLELRRERVAAFSELRDGGGEVVLRNEAADDWLSVAESNLIERRVTATGDFEAQGKAHHVGQVLDSVNSSTH